MLIDRRLVILAVLGVGLCALAYLFGWNAALGVFIVSAVAWSVSPFNGPTPRE